MEERAREQLLNELIDNQKKLVRQARFTSVINLIIGIVLIAALVTVIPRVRRVETSLTEIDQLVEDAGVLIENTNTMVTDNTDAVAETVQKLNDVDFETLNTAIDNLNTAIEPLAALAGLFS
jgi:hypothetical protein